MTRAELYEQQRRAGILTPNMERYAARVAAKQRDSLGLAGEVLIEEFNHDTGETRLIQQNNAVTNAFKSLVASLIAGDFTSYPNYIAVGTGALAQYPTSNRNAGSTFTGSDAASGSQFGQRFRVTANGTVSYVLVQLRRIGSSGGTIRAEIQTNSSGQPSGVPVTNGQSNTTLINSITTSYGWVKLEFPTPPSLVTGTDYHLVIKAEGYTYSAGVNEFYWGSDTSSPSYSNGEGHSWNGTVWATIGAATDFIFRVVASPDVSRTALLDELDRNQMDSKTASGATARLLAIFNTGEANDFLGEVGMFTAAVGGTLLAIAKLSYEKTSSNTISIYWLVKVL